jgi:hypothetical protein
METFMKVYEAELRFCLKCFPSEYAYTDDGVALVLDRMRTAIQEGTYNKDSRAIKRTCKALGIKHTYTAIKNYLEITT